MNSQLVQQRNCLDKACFSVEGIGHLNFSLFICFYPSDPRH